jgi:hypothetical protein
MLEAQSNMMFIEAGRKNMLGVHALSRAGIEGNQPYQADNRPHPTTAQREI